MIQHLEPDFLPQSNDSNSSWPIIARIGSPFAISAFALAERGVRRSAPFVAGVVPDIVKWRLFDAPNIFEARDYSFRLPNPLPWRSDPCFMVERGRPL